MRYDYILMNDMKHINQIAKTPEAEQMDKKGQERQRPQINKTRNTLSERERETASVCLRERGRARARGSEARLMFMLTNANS